MAGPTINGSLNFAGYILKEDSGSPGQVLTLQNDGTSVQLADNPILDALFDQFTGLPLFDRFGNFVEVNTELDDRPLHDYGRNDSTTLCFDLGNRF